MSGGLPAIGDEKKNRKVPESARGGPTDVETEEEAKTVGSIVFAVEMNERRARGEDAMRELKGMCVEGVVTSVNQSGFFMTCGGQEFFVSKLSMPKDYAFDAVRGDRFVSDEDPGVLPPIVVKRGMKVRARVFALRQIEGGEWVSLASINDDYLGPVDDAPDSDDEDGQAENGSAGTKECHSQ